MDLEVDAEQHLHAVVRDGHALAVQQDVIKLSCRTLLAHPGDERQRLESGPRILGDKAMGACQHDAADDPVRRGRGEPQADAMVVGDRRDRKDDEQHPDAGNEEEERPGERK